MPQRLLRRAHMNVALLVDDEMGFEEATREEAASITTNQNITDWPGMLASDEVATAILDRLLHRSHLLDLSGRSYFCARPGPRSTGSSIRTGTRGGAPSPRRPLRLRWTSFTQPLNAEF